MTNPQNQQQNEPRPFFRPEILEAKKNKWTGHVVLARPFSFKFMIGCAAVVALVVVLFAFFGSYTRKTTVEGQLLPLSGLVRVYASDAGVVAEKKVSEGDFVKKGDVLLTLSMPKYSGGADVRERLTEEARLRKKLLEQEIARLKEVHENDARTAGGNIGRLQTQLDDVRSQIKGQNRRVALAKEVIRKYRPLLKKGFISEQQMMEYENEYLNQQSQLDTLKREEAGILRDLGEAQNTQKTMPDKQESELSQLNRTLSELNQESLNLDSQHEQTIRASKSGYVTTSNVEVGQQVDSSRLLMSIVPKDAELSANLYVPSSSIGFVKAGDSVVLRYQAYPYQKFGHATGKVVSVARTALGKQELAGAGMAFTEQPNQTVSQNQPVYLVKVKLDKQTIKVYGKNQPLQVGMALEADILNERKKLYEWVLDPLYSISGKLH
ncbi:HlyD family secretion protein [Neisseria chenwenguii]|uniref:Hemolysin D n=1 Tax=Neisseria chenwenguii TaxID=1853278 RepID=A0A220S1I3_9NEIS|nr:HlyD family efflux transporter periplasmic adaptor subunit [Neisseria chenwenguii]ASK27263.1 hemolysin D [Neisseria chenwenguii]ROV57061.1 HlyD family efflux transporter periplasmic adaptor subunit [Neisseria chenwenguii]